MSTADQPTTELEKRLAQAAIEEQLAYDFAVDQRNADLGIAYNSEPLAPAWYIANQGHYTAANNP